MKYTNGDLVVIIHHDEVTELQMARQAGSLARDTLHGTSIPKESVGVVVYDVEAGLVELGGGVCLSDGQTDRICESLTKRTSRHFDAFGIMGLRVTWCCASD